MALSNMLREPRREITETLLGLVAFIPFAWVDWRLYLALKDIPMHDGSSEPTPFWLVVFLSTAITIVGSIVVLIVVIGGSMLVHWVGEEACDLLDNWGLDPRPTQRYR